jgi:hypothetical protein
LVEHHNLFALPDKLQSQTRAGQPLAYNDIIAVLFDFLCKYPSIFSTPRLFGDRILSCDKTFVGTNPFVYFAIKSTFK